MTTRYIYASRADPRTARLDDMRSLRAWAAACHHMRKAGVPPLPPDYIVRALRRRGWWPR